MLIIIVIFGLDSHLRCDWICVIRIDFRLICNFGKIILSLPRFSDAESVMGN